MSELGPRCQYFVWPPLFFSTALTLLGMEFTTASQVATGAIFHSSMMTSQSWWMLEILRSSTFRLRMPHRLPLPSTSLGRQWSSRRCVWGCYHVGILPCEGSGIMLCFSMSQYILAFMVPSMNCSSPVLAALMQPQTMTLPPPCLIVGKTHLSLYSSLVAATHAWHHLNQISLSWSHQTTGHGSSNPLMAVCLVILSGQHIYTVIQAVHSLHCSKVSFHKCCHMKR